MLLSDYRHIALRYWENMKISRPYDALMRSDKWDRAYLLGKYFIIFVFLSSVCISFGTKKYIYSLKTICDLLLTDVILHIVLHVTLYNVTLS